ncbi:hypothetical protein AB0C21_33990 [Spirillospora sp. NPDC049024]
MPSEHYPWIALSNTTLGMLLATVNSSIVIISLPAIFRGIHLNPSNRAMSATCCGCWWAPTARTRQAGG